MNNPIFIKKICSCFPLNFTIPTAVSNTFSIQEQVCKIGYDVNESLTEVETNLNQMLKEIDDLTTKIENIETDVDGKFDTIEDKITTIETDITSINNSIELLNTRANNLQQQIDNNYRDIAENRNNIDKNINDIETINNSLTTINQRIDNNYRDIAENTNNIDTILTTIGNINNSIEQLNTKVATINTNIDTINNNIESNTRRIESAENTLAIITAQNEANKNIIIGDWAGAGQVDLNDSESIYTDIMLNNLISKDTGCLWTTQFYPNPNVNTYGLDLNNLLAIENFIVSSRTVENILLVVSARDLNYLSTDDIVYSLEKEDITDSGTDEDLTSMFIRICVAATGTHMSNSTNLKRKNLIVAVMPIIYNETTDVNRAIENYKTIKTICNIFGVYFIDMSNLFTIPNLQYLNTSSTIPQTSWVHNSLLNDNIVGNDYTYNRNAFNTIYKYIAKEASNFIDSSTNYAYKYNNEEV